MKKTVLSMLVMSSMMFASGKVIAPLAVVESVDENSFYAGVGLAALSARDNSVSMSFFQIEDGQDRLGNFTLHAGYWLTEYLAVEGRYSAGFQDDDAIEMHNGWSLFLRPTYKFDDDENRANGENYFAVYALLGYGDVSFSGVNKLEGDIDNTDFQWGLGLSYTFRAISSGENYPYRDTWTVFADYTSLGRDMEGIILDYPRKADLDALTVGVAYHF